MDPSEQATLDVTYQSMAGLSLGQLAIAVLRVLIITTEYSRSGIKTTLTAVPTAFAAKGIVFDHLGWWA
jgi:hypothetical protein